MSSPDWFFLLPLLVNEAPTLLLTVIGLILARSKMLPRGAASVLATLGFALLLVSSILQLGFQIYVVRSANVAPMVSIAVWSLGMRVVSLAALICLSSAIFVGRAKAES